MAAYRTTGDPLGTVQRKKRPKNFRTRTYATWCNMKQRCVNPNIVSWKYYGGRGISVCERWQDFDNFLADMGDKPEGLSLDRIDYDGNYEPGNCRWATTAEQAENRRLTRDRRGRYQAIRDDGASI